MNKVIAAFFALAFSATMAHSGETLKLESGQGPIEILTAQTVRPPAGTRPPGAFPPPVLPQSNWKEECRRQCTADWETNRAACLALTGPTVVRECLEEILQVRDDCYASCG